MKQWKKNLLLALLAAAVITLCAGARLFRRADKWTQDLLFQRPGAVSPDIVVIGLDEQTLEALGPYYTWGRGVMADALEILARDPAALPAVVAIDTLYAGEGVPEEDARLAAAAEKLPAVVTAAAASFGTVYTPAEGSALQADTSVVGFEAAYPALRAVAQTGHINAMNDQDGIMRHALLYVDVPPSVDGEGGGRVYSMAWEAARLFREKQGLASVPPDTDDRGFFYIPYTAGPGGYSDGYSLADLLQGGISPAVWADRLVLIGPYAPGFLDACFTPVSRSKLMYGVEVQANVIQSFLEGNYKREAAEAPQLAALFLVSLGAMLLFLALRPGRALWAALGLAIGAPAAETVLYHAFGLVTHVLWLPAAAALLFTLAVARHYAQAAVERQRVTHTFERYVAPEIVREILREGVGSLALGGSVREIAVLFVDIRGFTALSERLSPEKVVLILNRYLALASECVEKNGGTLDKFVGDAAMAFWGAPLTSRDPVYQAARTAVEIVEGARKLSEELKSETGEALQVGVGVHWGPAVVGNMGSLRRMDYTAIGDTVNTAARLESNAPGGVIYISRAVADALGSRARTTSLGGAVRLKGKAEGFEVLRLDTLETDDGS